MSLEIKWIHNFCLLQCVFQVLSVGIDQNFEVIFIKEAKEFANKLKAARFLDATRDKLLKSSSDKKSFHTSLSKISPFSIEVDQLFKIALEASKKLKTNASIATLKLRAPPQFCPFPFNPRCDINEKYRTNDGSCNNLLNTNLGKSATPFKRYLPTAYDDGINSPRRTSVDGRTPLPNARSVSLSLHQPSETSTDLNNMGVMFGQFIDHDFALSASSSGSDGQALQCTCGSSNNDCVNIDTPREDMFQDQRCMILTRSGASFQKFDCTLNEREQLNLITHFLDLSQIYGSDDAQALKMRLRRGGQLTSSTINGFDNVYLPFAPAGTCVSETRDQLCFESGDLRTSQNLLLVSVHTVWLREHNRIATELRKLNPAWTDENLFQEARRITTAEYQNILYSEWLPIFIGKKLAKSNNLLNQLDDTYFLNYNESTNPHLASEFSTVTYRFGHTLVRSFATKSDRSLKSIGNLTLTSIFLRPIEAYVNGGIDAITRGLLIDAGTPFDTHMTDELETKLFESFAPNTQTHRFSLSSINIMRGRDHGITDYNKFRKFANLKEAENFDDLTEIPSEARQKLKSVYTNVNDIDAFTGGTSESPVADGLVGPTFAFMLAKQFRELKEGDRHYFENGHDERTRFTLPQLNELRKSTLARIMCDNVKLDSIPENAFLLRSATNPAVSCDNLPTVNLNLWTDEPL